MILLENLAIGRINMKKILLLLIAFCLFGCDEWGDKQSSTKFKWVDINGKERTYIPDFKIIKENKEEIIEIKGDYFFDKNGKFFNPYDKTEKGYKNAELK